jgi:hypothetical protein
MNEGAFVHVRRCHVCGHVSERSENQVECCDQCGKRLAPYYFFDESAVPVYSVDEQLPEFERDIAKDPKDHGSERRAIRGFSLLW